MNIGNIIFTGDSFTWGEAVELCDVTYNNYIEPICKRDGRCYDYGQFKFIQNGGYVEGIRNSLRYSNKVANHFNIMNFQPTNNGGDNLMALDFSKRILKEFNDGSISHVIMNLTHPYRSMISDDIKKWFLDTLEYEIQHYHELNEIHSLWVYTDVYKKTNNSDRLVSNRNLYNSNTKVSATQILPSDTVLNNIQDKFKSFQELESVFLFQYFKELSNKIKYIEDESINVLILNSWDVATYNFFNTCEDVSLTEFYNNRFITLDDGEFTYDSLYSLIQIDKYNTYKTHPWSENYHMTAVAHEVVANSIIKKLT